MSLFNEVLDYFKNQNNDKERGEELLRVCKSQLNSFSAHYDLEPKANGSHRNVLNDKVYDLISLIGRLENHLKSM